MTSPLSEPDPTLVERVRKLLDKAARTDNQHESDTFARKAAELVARHRIDPDRLAARPLPDDLALVRDLRRAWRLRAGSDQPAEPHRRQLTTCGWCFRRRRPARVATLAGRRDDLSIVEVMYASLHQQVASQMSEIRRSTGAATQRQRRAFLFGFADSYR